MPLEFISDRPILFVVWILAIVISLSVHEFSHAVAGQVLGDETAKRSGRLTLNPFAHIDPVGFLMLILVGFGWGKPVPFNPHNLKYPRWGPVLVAFAGPLANLVGVVVFGIVLKILFVTAALPVDNLLIQFLGLLVIINLILMLFNIIPIPPLDGSKLLLSFLAAPQHARTRFLLETRGPLILLGILILDSLFGLNVFGRLFGAAIAFVYQFLV